MKIFITGGVGDVFAIISLMSNNERDSVEEIYYATRAEALIRQITKYAFKNLKKEITVCNEFTPSEVINENPYVKEYIDKFCISTMNDLKRFNLLIDPELLNDVVDYSLQIVSNDKLKGIRKYYGLDCFLKNDLNNVDFSVFPEKYYYIHPWSDNQRYPERDFLEKDCIAVTKYLEKHKIYGVVINKSKDKWPIESEYVLDFTNNYSFLECIDIMKKATGFIGCASTWSVFAPKLYDIQNIFIKGVKELKHGWWKFYYEPAKSNYFLHESLDHMGEI